MSGGRETLLDSWILAGWSILWELFGIWNSPCARSQPGSPGKHFQSTQTLAGIPEGGPVPAFNISSNQEEKPSEGLDAESTQLQRLLDLITDSSSGGPDRCSTLGFLQVCPESFGKIFGCFFTNVWNFKVEENLKQSTKLEEGQIIFLLFISDFSQPLT